ncbi:serine/threonine protein kinase [Candidatus Acidianus copahuensis]|uniref:Serine/threonine protein kinase n=1 Tax=Candidatus Acidianus copahuensis TaxID=1160895 RepID=A0A031LR76_9CREN|nr:serine/threonine protein kinase [Candidatus Acidianus copahuensis]
MIKSFYWQSKIVKIGDSKYVLKCYSANAGIKWYFISSLFSRSYPYSADPLLRMRREVDFLTFPWKKITVPKLIDIDYYTNCIIREFSEGREPSTTDDFYGIGYGLRAIHDNEFVMGDTKLENFLLSNEKTSVIDAEQAIKSNNVEYKSWDILVFSLFLAYKYMNDLKGFDEMMLSFLRGYGPSSEITKNIISLRNLNLLSFFPAFHLNNLKKLIHNFN